MLGGNVAYDSNVAEGIALWGRVSSSGVVNAPTNPPKFTVNHSATGVYIITLFDNYAQYLGTQITLESSGFDTNAVSFSAAYTAANTTTGASAFITIHASNAGSGTDVAFAFMAKFSESAIS